MVQITKYHSGIKIQLLGWHKLWAFKDYLVIPAINISNIHHAPDTKLGWWKGWRIPGTHVPGLIVAGTYYRNKKKYFWDVVNAQNTVVLEVNNFKYDEIHVEVQDPAETVKLVTEQMN